MMEQTHIFLPCKMCKVEHCLWCNMPKEHPIHKDELNAHLGAVAAA